MKKRSIYLLFGVLLASCSGAEEDGTNEGTESQDEFQTIIEPPLDGDFQNDTLFKIDPTQETVVSTPNGTSIEFPANILVDKDGNPVTSPVEVSFTQYHSMTDILASGIPMTYEDENKSGNFISAGMFTIRAKSEGKEVFVKDGESYTVNLASDKGSEEYDNYTLNEQTGNWTFDPEPAMPIRRNPRFDPASWPMEPQKADKNSFALDLNFDLSDYSELEVFSGIVWEYAGDHDSLDPRTNPIVGSTQWQDFELEPTFDQGFEYFLTMTAGEKKFTTVVKAALQGQDFDNAMAAFKERKKEIADEMDQLQKPFIRSISMDGFMTRNYDYVHQMADPNPMLADFDFESDNESKDKALVFVMYPEIDLIVQYPESDWSQFALDKADECHILAVQPNNKLSVFKGNHNDCYGKSEYTFKMSSMGVTLNGKSDLENAIASL